MIHAGATVRIKAKAYGLDKQIDTTAIVTGVLEYVDKTPYVDDYVFGLGWEDDHYGCNVTFELAGTYRVRITAELTDGTIGIDERTIEVH